MSKLVKEKTTEKLKGALQTIKTKDEMNRFIRENASGGYDGFAEYFNEYMVRNDLNISDIVKNSDISNNYVYNILNGERKPRRDKVLALCIGAGMNYTETNRALKLSGANELYPKNERDVRIAIYINNGKRNVMELNLELEEAGLDIIN